MRTLKIPSAYDGLELDTAILVPEGAPRAIVQISHGMAEHKERYFDFMRFLSENGFVCVIHDHRGHGGSVKSPQDYGYFYTEDEQAVVDDVHTVTAYVRQLWPGLPIWLFGHSMGSLIARCYLKKYDAELSGVILCGPPTRNSLAGFGLGLAKLLNHVYPEKKPNMLLNAMAFGGYHKGINVLNGWISFNEENVTRYNDDPQCGFGFTTNGFINLLKLQKGAYESEDWQVRKPELPVFIIAGESDPVIISKENFRELAEFLGKLGYRNIKSRLFSGMRHEVLNEKEHETVYRAVVDFINEAAQG